MAILLQLYSYNYITITIQLYSNRYITHNYSSIPITIQLQIQLYLQLQLYRWVCTGVGWSHLSSVHCTENITEGYRRTQVKSRQDAQSLQWHGAKYQNAIYTAADKGAQRIYNQHYNYIAIAITIAILLYLYGYNYITIATQLQLFNLITIAMFLQLYIYRYCHEEN